MTSAARDGGASCLQRLATGLLQATALLWMAVPVTGAELSLLHADATTVRALAPVGADTAQGALDLELVANGKLHRLHLTPHGDLGEEAGARTSAQAYRGDVAQLDGSWVALTRVGSHWTGLWYDGVDYYGIERAADLASLSPAAAAMPPGTQAVYRLRDVLWDNLSLHGDTRRPTISGEDLVKELADSAPEKAAARASRLGITAVADAPLAALHADVRAELLAQVNLIDGIYSSQLGLRVVADEVVVFDRADRSPFSDTDNADQLLDELSDWRLHRRQRETGLTHLFTGRRFDGRIVGMAYVSSVCSRRFSASLSESTLPTGLAALIAAHEIGHVLGAPHDGDPAGACAATPSDFLMAPRINGSQQLSDCSRSEMQRSIAAASCLNVWRTTSVLPMQTRPQLQADGGGGGALSGLPLGLLGVFCGARVRRRVQTRANQSAR